MRTLVVAFAWDLGVVVPLPLAAQGEVAPRCQDPRFREFDFWIGEWNVTGPDGAAIGRSVIEPIMGRCAVRESWDSGEVHGTSVSIYHAPDEAWFQTWVDNRGVLLRLRGGWDGDRMILAGERRGSDGRVRHLRITWTPTDEGLIQRQEVSEDGGESWAVGFEGRYERALSTPPGTLP